MKKENNKKYILVYILVGIACIALASYFGSMWFWSFQTVDPGATSTTPEEYCIERGGVVKTQLCCNSVGDFPNTCLIGACGCSPANSHEIKVCDCGEGKCWNGHECGINSNP